MLLHVLIASLQLASAAPAADCPEGSVLVDAKVRFQGSASDYQRIVDGIRAPEGTAWDDPRALRLEGDQGITWTFDEPTTISAILIQADDNDHYLVEGSTDGQFYRRIWEVAPAEGVGLRSRTYAGVSRDMVSFRVRPLDGDGYYSISEFSAWCDPPSPWPPPNEDGEVVSKPRREAPQADEPIPDRQRRLAWTKLLWGLFAGVTLAGLTGARRRERISHTLHSRVCLGLILASIFVWTNLWTFHGNRAVHLHDSFHYVLGARYFPELGFNDLYRCAVTVETEGPEGRGPVVDRRVRRLTDNRIFKAGRLLQDGERCKPKFTERRWGEFTRDVLFFKQGLGDRGWNHALMDHGYNATPVWTTLASPITGRGQPGIAHLRNLGHIDTLSYLAFFGFLVWGFGWEVGALAAIIWAAGYPWAWYWTGGSFGRATWLLCAGAGLAFWKKDYQATAGFMFATAALLRAWPLLLLAGPAVAAVEHAIREQKVARRDLRWIAGVGLATVLLGGAATVQHGPDVWPRFSENSAVHAATPLTNHMGMEAVLWWDYDTRARKMRAPSKADPFGPWKQARRDTIEDRAPLGILWGGALMLLVVGASIQQRERWEAASTSVVVVMTMLVLTSYDYVMVTLLAPLAARHPAMMVLFALMASGTQVIHLTSTWMDEQHTMASAWVLLLTVIIVGWSTWGPVDDDPV